jgi:hypothetical protein
MFHMTNIFHTFKQKIALKMALEAVLLRSEVWPVVNLAQVLR